MPWRGSAPAALGLNDRSAQHRVRWHPAPDHTVKRSLKGRGSVGGVGELGAIIGCPGGQRANM